MALPAGNHPGNTGGKKGRSGRKPKPFLNFAKAVMEAPETQREIRGILKDRSNRHFAAVMAKMAGYAEGEPVQKIVTENLNARGKLSDFLTRIADRRRSTDVPDESDG